jgi:hypothetical protein
MRSLGINKVKPTPMQLSTFENIKRGMKLRDAMLAGGYSEQTSKNTKQKLVESRGFQEVLAEIQAEGLFDADAKVRLDYIRENKRDLGLLSEKGEVGNTVNILVIPGELIEKYDISSDTINSSER